MMQDNETFLSDKQAIKKSSNSDNVYDSGVDAVIGASTSTIFRVTVVEELVGLTSIAVQLVASDSEDLKTNPSVLVETPPILAADLTVGALIFGGHIPIGPKHRYLGVKYIVDGSATSGAIDASLVLNQPEHFVGKSGFKVGD